jgi:hypothetical protein
MSTEPTTDDQRDSVAVQRLVLPGGDFSPRHPIYTPDVLVRPMDQPEHAPMPFHYFINPMLRHAERRTGMAGDVNGNSRKI